MDGRRFVVGFSRASLLPLALLPWIAAGCGPNASSESGAPGRAGASETASAPEAVGGEVLYRRYCKSCHGAEGKGDGISAVAIATKPRNFTTGVFKFAGGRDGLPSDEDLFRTITNGIPGTDMQSYRSMPEADRRALVQYVKSLAVGRFEIEDEDEDADLLAAAERIGEENGTKVAYVNWFKYRGVCSPLPVPEPPPATDDLVARGRELYLGAKAECFKCHGDAGRGDGPSAPGLADDWGQPVKPRDFTTGVFKVGNDPRDLYRRITLGVPGTPMPSCESTIPSEQDRWALVYFVLSLRQDPFAATGGK